MSFSASGETMPLIFGFGERHYKPNYRLKWLKNKGAILVVFWSFLVNSVYHGFQYMTLDGSKKIGNENLASPKPTGIILVSLALLFPVGGWLADSYVGRHKMIRYSTWIMWISVFLVTLWYILSEYVLYVYLSKHNCEVVKTVVLVILYIMMGIGLAGFQANIIQLGIDQLRDASSTEITSFITSYVTALYTSGVAFYFINSCNGYPITVKGYNLLMMLYVAVCLTLAVCLDFIFGSCLVKESVPVTTNSATLIAKVVRYVIKNRNHSFGVETTSIFDIAKYHFGGPYENHHVDQVKTFIRMTAVSAIASIVCGQIIVFDYAQGELQLRFRDWNNYTCFVQTSVKHSNYICGTIAILFYEIVIYPLFNRWIPTARTMTVFMIGIFLSLLTICSFLGIEVGAYLKQSSRFNVTVSPSKSCLHHDNVDIEFSSLWVIVIGSLNGLYTLLLILSAYEFMWAQAPSTMKGLILGIMYAFLGLSAMLQSAISAPFLFIHTSWRNLPLSCGIWYYLMQMVIVFVTFAVFYFIVKRYRQSQRNELGLQPVSLVNDVENEP